MTAVTFPPTPEPAVIPSAPWATSRPGELALLGDRRDIVVIGAAMGGLSVLCKLVSRLPSVFDAAILIALDLGSQPALVVLQILRSYSRLPVDYATDGTLVRRNRVFVAPGRHNMRVVQPGILALDDLNAFASARPSVDELFKSVAGVYGRRVIALVLSGASHDGTSGLTAIEAAGGVGVVQDPDGAVDSAMPLSAMRGDHPDYCSSLDRMAALVISLAAGERPSDPTLPGSHG